MESKKSVCVIGAGTSGLSAIKYSLEYGLDVECFEQSKELGGTWVYESVTENVTFDNEVHSSMYEGLYTNAPKEIMGFNDFEFPAEIDESFVSSEKVLNFLKSYASHFNLEPYIKFSHSVIRVRPLEKNWEVIVLDLENSNYLKSYFDFVFVCNGHYTKPRYPNIEGMDIFKGRQLHSHLYRKSEYFKDGNVLIIGAGFSAVDITDHVRKDAKKVYVSHHLNPAPNTDFMKNVTQKPDVKCFTETGAIFKDGSTETLSAVIFCTGYKYSFPFLSVDTGIRVQENAVYPLYKHCININHPTMAFIGIPYNLLLSQSFDLQVRFTLAYFMGKRQLPSKSEMKADLEQEIAERLAEGIPKHQFHNMLNRQYDYYKEISDLAGIKNIKPVVQNIMKDLRNLNIHDIVTYRHTRYRIIDNEKFIKY